MVDFHDCDILDYEYDLGGYALLGPNDQEEEPMDQGDNDSDCCILEEDEDQPQLPTEPPAEQEEQGLFVCVDRDIFEQDEPSPVPASQSSLYGIYQLIRDIKVPTPEDPEVPPRSPRTETALRPVSLDWSTEVEHNTHLSPVWRKTSRM